ncbi:FAD-dependent monooxygenase [Actinokineospora sp. HUAS TT18]|uniref:FAD-dependent monooxygenase n=1 Tax=Actinokineospora sp. HUAS TT18 TaxID=3447451 RepID=UPI003F51BB75
MGERYDAIIVGARVAGATLATRLAQAGWRVLLLDRDQFPSDTVSTHMMFPNTLQRLDELGVLRRLQAAHRIPFVHFGWRVHGHQVAGDFTPVGGFDRAASVRRIVLDATLVDTARDAGVHTLFGRQVDDLIGTDPVRGVVLDTGERIESRWVFGADGRMSTVARRLGLPTEGERRGEMAFLMAYWRGLPESEWCHIDLHERAALMSAPAEDGIHLLSLAGPPEFTRGSAEVRERRYRDGLHQFPAVLNPRLLDSAERISPLVVVPETMMRGHYRQAAGAGWALLGDAGHFKHPSTAQGIGDAVEQAWYLASALTEGDDLSGYQRWRDARAEEHYDWSFQLARFGTNGSAAHYAGLAADPVAGQGFLDTFTKLRRPSEVLTRDRVARWSAAWAYEDGQRRVRALVEDLDPAALATLVPACPEWTVRDLVAHLTGVAQDSVRGTYFAGALDAWRDPGVAAARDRWTADQVAARAGLDFSAVLNEFDKHSRELVAMLRRGTGPDGPAWLVSSPASDLAVHLDDLREALGLPPDPESAAARFGFAMYRKWLHARIAERGLPALRLSGDRREWVLGRGEPAATVAAEDYELFRAITGRRAAEQVRGYEWSGSSDPYLAVISPYSLPEQHNTKEVAQ